MVNSKNGFTLLEVLIVLFILGLLAAMAVPAMGILDNRERERITLERMDLIRRAILGPPDCFDDAGRPVIGGYVGDMKAWPELWEAKAEIRPDFAGIGWENPSAMTPGLGQGPDYAVDPAFVFFRPSGTFENKRFRWNRPYRKLYDMPTHQDHIGGLETENEGQPRGLWTRYPEDLPFDLPGHPMPGADLGEGWKGPYLPVPRDMVLSDSQSWAESDGQYDMLEPVFHLSGPHANHETWEDGNNAPLAELGEHFDEKESFRMLETDGRLSDGWGRALRFFITADRDAPGQTVFWIISEGPDAEGSYPSKGTCTSHVWTVDAADTMGQAYDADDERNRDNLVMKLYSRDFAALLGEEEKRKIRDTEHILDTLVMALAGDSPAGDNTGFTGNLCRRPRLFQWEDNGTPDPTDDHWDDRDVSDAAYTRGQPVELWTRTPNSADPSDDVSSSLWGLGFRYRHLPAPSGTGGGAVLRDAWGREILCFSHTGDGAFFILSTGPDGRYDFGDPSDPTFDLSAVTYDPAAADNADNIVRILNDEVMGPGFFRLDRLVVLNAVAGVTRSRFFRSDEAPVAGVDLLTCSALIDHDGDTVADDWVAGDGSPLNPAFRYDDTTAVSAKAGARYLVIWNDTDGNDQIDTGEYYTHVIYTVGVRATGGQVGTLTVDTADFEAY
ncbi:prepilin-type N-terminal cleavage/methylation domain-containing protein [Desulfatiferula olefinivorans]